MQQRLGRVNGVVPRSKYQIMSKFAGITPFIWVNSLMHVGPELLTSERLAKGIEQCYLFFMITMRYWRIIDLCELNERGIFENFD